MTTATSYSHETLVVDGEHYADCDFQDCRLVYAGGALPSFKDCRFNACDWKLDEAADRTIDLLRLVWNIGDKVPVQTIIKSITTVR